MSTQSIEIAQNARRCLFGMPDPEKLSSDLKRLDMELNEAGIRRFRERWSFDPETGPLDDGLFEYVPMDQNCPSFYTKGYSHCKSKPVLLVPDSLCITSNYKFGVLRKPGSAKRKLDLDDKDDDIHTNSGNVENVKQCLHLTSSDSELESSSVPMTHVADVPDNNSGDLYHSSLGLTGSKVIVPTIHGLSPVSRVKDVMTPTLVQKSVKDIFRTKKQRMNNTKVLPKS